jgi:hypothetical protein
MPAPQVRQDALWARRAAEEKARAKELAKAREELRNRCHANQLHENRQHKLERKRQNRVWDATQRASTARSSRDHEEQLRVRDEALLEIERQRLRKRKEEEEHEAKLRAAGRLKVEELLYESFTQTMIQLQNKFDRLRMTWAANPNAKAELQAMEDDRMQRLKVDQEAAAQAMRSEVADFHTYVAKAERASRRRARERIEGDAARRAARETVRYNVRRREAERKREANIHYLNTHGDRLHWTPPLFEHTLADGDGRWPYPMDHPKEPVPGVNWLAKLTA